MPRLRSHSLRFVLRLLLLVVAAALVAGPAFAQPVDQKKRWTARKLGGEGIDLYEAGDYAGALEKFKTADELVPAPTVKLYAARCLDKLDRMQEAAGVYRDAIEFALDRSSPPVHHQARKDAVKELAALMEQIPTVEVVVRGHGAGDAVVELDGRALAAEDLGKKLQVDPGAHSVKAQRKSDDVMVQQTVVAQRGQPAQVALELPDPEAPTPARPSRPGGDPNAGDGWRIGGGTTMAVSGAVLVVGVVLGIVVLDEKSALDEQCPDGQCPPEKQADVDSFDTLRTLSSIGILTGAAGLVSGVLMLALAPSPTEATTPSDDAVLLDVDVTIGAGPTGLGVHLGGRF